jgi:hypothetical protein
MNVPLLVAGSLALVGAAIHGGVGEVLVVRKLSPRSLPPSPFGGPALTKAMIRVAWHMATIGLVTVGCALVVSGSVLNGGTARGVGLVAAGASTGFAMLAVGTAFAQCLRSVSPGERRLVLHPGPPLLAAVAVLAWVGVA